MSLPESGDQLRLDHRLNNGRGGQRNSADSDQHDGDGKTTAGQAARRKVAISHGRQCLDRDIEAVSNRPTFNEPKTDGAEDQGDSQRDDSVANTKEGAESMGS